MTKILIIDDQKLFGLSLKKVLEAEKSDFRVLVAISGAKAMELLQTEKIDLILLDVHMPGSNGIETLKNINALYPGMNIIMLTAFGYDEYVRESMTYGAKGYILKDIAPENLLDIIDTVLAGGVVLSPEVSGGFFHNPSWKKTPEEDNAELISQLTPKEKDILILVAKGFSNQEIESRINLGSQTVRNYISRIYSKLELKDRFEAIRFAIESGLNNQS